MDGEEVMYIYLLIYWAQTHAQEIPHNKGLSPIGKAEKIKIGTDYMVHFLTFAQVGLAMIRGFKII